MDLSCFECGNCSNDDDDDDDDDYDVDNGEHNITPCLYCGASTCLDCWLKWKNTNAAWDYVSDYYGDDEYLNVKYNSIRICYSCILCDLYDRYEPSPLRKNTTEMFTTP